jgi:hypothetical protein
MVAVQHEGLVVIEGRRLPGVGLVAGHGVLLDRLLVERDLDGAVRDRHALGGQLLVALHQRPRAHHQVRIDAGQRDREVRDTPLRDRIEGHAGLVELVFEFGLGQVRGRTRLRPVRQEARNATQAWVRDGLAEGAQVTVDPPAAVGEGVRVAKR